ncbi:MAG: hypothetical protein GEU94_02215 [Micromonosporaceae bacterium]|nr:hypothetical protein [Micromonosporaceae bacterium]
MTTHDTSRPCVKLGHADLIGPPRSCLASLAEGWIGAQDLCGPCTRRFMAGLEWVAGEDLRWHSGYAERARDRVETPRVQRVQPLIVRGCDDNGQAG